LLEAGDDPELMAQAQAGDRAAFDSLVRRHYEAVLTYAYKVTGDDDRALEVAQESFVRAFRYRASFKPAAGSVRGWIFSIAANRIKDAARRRRSEPGSLDNAPEPKAPSGEGAVEVFARSARRDAILAALDALPADYKEIMVLRYLSELSYEEVATALKLTIGAVRMRALRARELLASALGSDLDPSEGTAR
jgi:RNA polymerase sigma-70 factor (ECF subfamily)